MKKIKQAFRKIEKFNWPFTTLAVLIALGLTVFFLYTEDIEDEPGSGDFDFNISTKPENNENETNDYKDNNGGDDNMEKIKLPEPDTFGRTPLEKTIQDRRSIRSFTDEGLEREEVSQLMWSAQGITDETEELRASPSAGATYPLEVYYIDEKGVYHYDPNEHSLELIRQGDKRSELEGASLGQGFIGEAPANIVIAAVFSRTQTVYGTERGERYVHIEAGHAAQNIHLQAVSLGLGSVPVGAFDDGSVREVLTLPDDHEPLYVIPVGHPR